MTVQEARANIGNAVMSCHHLDFPSYTENYARGPFYIEKVTKGGLVILEGRPDDRARPSMLRLVLPPSARALS